LEGKRVFYSPDNTKVWWKMFFSNWSIYQYNFYKRALKYHIGVLLYKSLNNYAPKYISDLFLNVSSPKYSLRSVSWRDIISKSKIASTKNLLNTFRKKVKTFGIWYHIYIRNTSSIKFFKSLYEKNCNRIKHNLVSGYLYIR